MLAPVTLHPFLVTIDSTFLYFKIKFKISHFSDTLASFDSKDLHATLISEFKLNLAFRPSPTLYILLKIYITVDFYLIFNILVAAAMIILNIR